MQIVESWEDHNTNSYAIVRHSEKDQNHYRIKKFEAMWLADITEKQPELNSFAGTVGYRIADFDTLEEAQDFLLKGIYEYDTDPDIWFKMLEVK